MAVTASPYWSLPNNLGQGAINFTTDTFKVALLDDTYTPDLVAHAWFDAVNPTEVVGDGYTAGGLVLTSCSWAYYGTEGVQGFNADWAIWTPASLTARYAVVYKDVGGVPADSPLVSLIDFGANKTVDGVDFALVWSDTGILVATIP